MADREKLSEKQRQILAFMKSHVLEKGYPPAVREIGAAVGLSSSSSVHAQLRTLEKKGYIRKDPTKPRAIEILDDDILAARNAVMDSGYMQEVVSIPVLGNVAAGEPIFAEENIQDYFSVNSEFLPRGTDSFMLRVKGESMINAGIYSGDLVMVSKTDDVRNGDIVVALVDDSATVKSFYKEKGHIRLQPENDTMDPIIVDDCTVLGRVVGLYRKY
ncbi:MAG: transcriptional repressor LexA [Lachnospiraceae bacterium]|nr:transcriptional repressor LexA [Lachnospiraceae bacterium]